ncbi:MFS transporter [Leifsonia poae]|uniref:MFS transporter n=1 Tax=Leifsonia poae TaxID=110933 RepID=UPI001CBCDB1A|nr:MFS transporter [Leifsonia poae]
MPPAGEVPKRPHGQGRGPDVFRLPGFPSYWAAGSVSEFGTYITTIALQVLVLTSLHGSAADIGLVNASRWIPYLLFGLVVGALVERGRRKPVLIVADAVRGVLLGLIPLLWLLNALSVATLMVFVAVFGMLSLVGDAAAQSFLPRLVPRSTLLAANARIDQSSSVAQTSGPAIGGAIVTLLGAPLAVLVDAASYLFSALAIARIRVVEPAPVHSLNAPRLGDEIREGLRWVYRHRVLGPYAVAVHVWFLFSSMLGTIFVPFMILDQHFSAFELGLTLSAAGVGGLVGSLFATRIGLSWGAGPAVLVCYAAMPIGWVVIALSPDASSGRGRWVALAALIIGQAVFGLALGASNANEMGYRQAVTPDALQGRTNTTMRSFNRAAIIVGAPLGGVLADTIGSRPTLWIAIGGFILVFVALLLSPFRTASHLDVSEG